MGTDFKVLVETSAAMMTYMYVHVVTSMSSCYLVELEISSMSKGSNCLYFEMQINIFWEFTTQKMPPKNCLICYNKQISRVNLQ